MRNPYQNKFQFQIGSIKRKGNTTTDEDIERVSIPNWFD